LTTLVARFAARFAVFAPAFSKFSTVRPLLTTTLATARPVARAALPAVVAGDWVVSSTGAFTATMRNETIAFSAVPRRL
jgi:hypothetical protein